MTEIVWGPEIAVDGKRPEWLEDGDALDVRWSGPDHAWYTADVPRGAKPWHVEWDGAVAIRLPADHPHYAELSGISGQLDWSKPIEAVHEDGRTVSLALSDQPNNPDSAGDFYTGSIEGQSGIWHPDGTPWEPEMRHRASLARWRIRNVAQATAQSWEQRLQRRVDVEDTGQAPIIPAGMKRWYGDGENLSAPDWDGGEVLFDNGRTGMPVGHQWQPFGAVIVYAYYPKGGLDAASKPHPAPSPSDVGPEVVGVEKPAYVPAHKLPCWLSSEDVKAEIMKLAENGADKAVCWDMMQAVYRLADRALEKEAGL